LPRLLAIVACEDSNAASPIRRERVDAVLYTPMNSSAYPSPLDETEPVVERGCYNVSSVCDKWMHRFGMDVRELFGSRETFSLFEGVRTGCQFFRPLEIAGNSAFYEQLQRFDWYYAPTKWEHRTAARLLKRSRRVLEIGCGTGHFLEELRRRGIADVEGWELNPAAALEGQRCGRPVFERNLFDAAEEDEGKWDAVCSFQVLEHVPSPLNFSEACYRAAKPGGLVLFAVPDNDAFLARDDDNVLNLPPHHMSRWSLRSFSALGELLGMELLLRKREPLAARHVHWFVELLMRGASSKQRPRRDWLVFNRLFGWIAPVLLKSGVRQLIGGQSMLIAFRKP
jgi:SAM-dependent methyltransferase